MIQAGEEEAEHRCPGLLFKVLGDRGSPEEGKQIGWRDSSLTHHPGPRGHLEGERAQGA